MTVGSDTTVRIAATVDITITARTTGRQFILRCPNPTNWHELNDVAGELMRQSLLLRPNYEMAKTLGSEVTPAEY